MKRGLFLSAMLLAAAMPALALEYLSVTAPTLLFDAPSAKSKPKLIIQPGTPVEPLVNVEGFVKVREPQGGIYWIEKKMLSEKRTVMVRVDRAQIYKAADEKSPLAFEAERQVVLDLAGPPASGWAAVRHRDGANGFIRVQQVYGL